GWGRGPWIAPGFASSRLRCSDWRRLANRRTPTRRFGLPDRARRHGRRPFGRRRRVGWRCALGRRRIEIGDGMCELSFGQCRSRELVCGREFLLRVLPGLIGPGMRSLAIALPIAAAAAAAAGATPLVTARLFAPFMQLRCQAAGCFKHSFILSSFVSLGLIIGGLGDRDLLDMRLGVVRQTFATAAPTTAPPPPPPRSAFVGLGSSNVRFGFELGLFRLACLAATLFEIVLS